MSTASVVQAALYSRLVATAAVTDLVPAGNILDINSRPAPDPAILLGEDQEVDEGRIDRNVTRIYSTLHVWKKEVGLEGVKAIAGAVRKAVNAGRLQLPTGFHCGDCYVSSSRFLRDPDGETAHGVVTIETLIAEVA